jgi:hypothetical protein
VWKVERMLLEYPHRSIATSRARIRRLRRRYRAFKARHPAAKPLYYGGRDRWTEIPGQFLLGAGG